MELSDEVNFIIFAKRVTLFFPVESHSVRAISFREVTYTSRLTELFPFVSETKTFFSRSGVPIVNCPDSFVSMYVSQPEDTVHCANTLEHAITAINKTIILFFINPPCRIKNTPPFVYVKKNQKLRSPLWPMSRSHSCLRWNRRNGI